ncbi:MAG: siroheme synthase CysG [Alphaproteobacteria bacterium]|nr:siroheme synthase CysG [Alphaproteobacteria bacterium]
MKYFPLFADLRGRDCLVVGGGERAARKLRLLLGAGARPVVAAAEVNDEIRGWAEDGKVRIEPTAAVTDGGVAGDLSGYALIVVADAADDVVRAVSAAARKSNTPVNVVDRPELSTFVMPGIVDREPVLVAIGSGGAAPVLVRRLREQIERVLPAKLGALARFAQRYRSTVREIETAGTPKRFWEEFFDGPIAQAVLAGRAGEAAEGMLRRINRGPAAGQEAGSVALVGAGPGDPDLLTLRALRAMQDADVVVYDRLIGDGILDLVRRDAERIYVGKAPGRHSLDQEGINRLLAARARAGQRVVRLKGGDPFLFGRGGEELAHLRAAGVSVEVIPGITAAVGCAAAAGMPLTHRGAASGVTFISGHSRAGGDEPDWAGLAASGNTLVIYMGVATAGHAGRELLAHGMRPETPVAVIENGTRPDQRVIRDTLAGLAAGLARHGVGAPAVIVIGEVAAFAEAASAQNQAEAAPGQARQGDVNVG